MEIQVFQRIEKWKLFACAWEEKECKSSKPCICSRLNHILETHTNIHIHTQQKKNNKTQGLEQGHLSTREKNHYKILSIGREVIL